MYSYTLSGAVYNTGQHAQKLFNYCYLPAVVNGWDHPLYVCKKSSGCSDISDTNAIVCDHNSILSGAVNDYYTTGGATI